MTPAFSEEYHRRSAETLDLALERVSAYAAWKARDPGPGVHPDARFPALPALTKSDLREHGWRGYIPAGADADAALASGEIELVETSGTTSERVTNVWHQEWWDESERRSWRYNAHTMGLPLGGHREAILTSPHNTGRLSDGRPLSGEERTIGRFLYLNERSSPLLWTDDLLDRMLAELELFRPIALEANPSYLARLSLHARRRKVRPYQPPVIILTYENPTRLARKLIRLSFESPLASSYGSTEAGYVLMECEQGALHQNASSCRIDFEPLKPEHGGPDLGRIFVTAFDHPFRVLVRFAAGDLVRLAPGGSCACGRDHGYVVREVAGRVSDLTFAADGRARAPSDIAGALGNAPGLVAYAVTQTGRAEYEATVELDRSFGRAKTEALVRDRLIELYGDGARVSVTPVERLAPEPSGKYRPARVLFPVDEESLFRKGGA